MESFSSVLTTLQTTLEISHTVFAILIVVLFIPWILFTVWKLTGSISIGIFVTIPVMIVLTIMGFIPMWLCVLFGIIHLPLLLMNTIFIGGESKAEPTNKKRRVYKNKILCKFIHANGEITEQWTDGKNNVIKYETGIYFIEPYKICMAWNGSRFYPIIYYYINSVIPILTKGQTIISNEIELDKLAREDILMTNQLIQDPNKLSIKAMEQKLQHEGGYMAWNPILNKSIVDNTLGFKSINFDRGTKIAVKLDTTHRQILEIFDNDIFNGANSLVDTNKIKGLELDLYNSGIQVLKHVYDLAQQLQQSKIDELNNTNKELTDKLGTLLDKASPMYKLTSDRLDINNKSLGMIKKYNDAIDELICQVELYIDTISEMCLELPELLNHTAQSDITAKIQEINDRIAMGQRVKSEYVKEGI